MSQIPETDGSGHPRRRRDSVDFWRGVLLCTIFINHVPGNVFEPFTPKNYGFSDSAEAFVFLSGLSLALAYGRRFSGGDARAATLGLARRAARLYGLHILLSVLGLAIFGIGAALSQSPGLLNDHGRGLLVEDPARGILGLVLLGHQLGYFNILPVYVLMIAMTPALLWLGRFHAWVMLAVSGLIYGAARLGAWNLPTWPIRGTWFFDPLAWQFLLTLGIAVGLRSASASAPLPRLVLPIGIALSVIAFAAFSVTDGLSLRPGLQDWTRSWADLDKTTLGSGRLIHFLSIAYVLYALRIAERLSGCVLFKPLCSIGRNSIWIFCFLSLLAAIGQVVTGLFGHPLLLDIVLIGAGLMLLHRMAKHLDRERVTARRRPAAQPSLWTETGAPQRTAA